MNTRKLAFPDGSQVGIVNLDSILREVADLKLTDALTIKTELLDRVKSRNYVPPSAEHDYSIALYHEYLRKAGAIQDEGKTEAHKHTAG